MRIRRRQFLGSAVAGTTGAMVAGSSAPAAKQPVDRNPVATVPLAKDLNVCRMGLGTGMRGGGRQSNQTRLGYEGYERLILHAYDEGIRLFDLADLYGSHQFTAKALKDKPRDSYYLVSKIWFRKGGIPEEQRPDADVVVKRFLEELDTDYIDLVQLHCTTSNEWTSTLARQMEIMDRLKEKGLVRAHGTSCHSIGALQAAAADPWIDVVHTRINPEGKYMDGPPEKVVPELKKLHAAGKGLIGMKLIGQGDFRDDGERKQKSIEYVMKLGVIDVMIFGCESPEEVTDCKTRVAQALTTMADS